MFKRQNCQHVGGEERSTSPRSYDQEGEYEGGVHLLGRKRMGSPLRHVICKVSLVIQAAEKQDDIVCGHRNPENILS